ncbi:hypothetical protein JTB14_012338 [Gonioctena quinquepunctata]|nr:hypothetical protein JTB14_012338 [Gonioctena quinquepunctata]
MQYVLPFLLYFMLAHASDDSILCTPNYCDKVKCPSLIGRCAEQNSTHNGVIFPSLDACNCCEYCLENLDEGELCAIGNPATSSPKSICGPGLTCQLLPNSDYDGKCVKMSTTCTKKQMSFDERRAKGTLGRMEVRQSCDNDGFFVPYNCIPGQSCYCVDKNGIRIFGELDFTSLPDLYMQCKCSRDAMEAAEIIGKELQPDEHFRCTANGDYDVIQHIGEKFFCVDAADGAPKDPVVNISSIVNLTCYREGFEKRYYKKCENEYLELLEEVKSFNVDTVVGFTYPKCDFDGTYQAVQENSTHKICVDKEGSILLAVDKKEHQDLANSMNCKCLRALAVTTTNEKPTCADNGNYEPVQCRRGACRCVDSDGNQVCSKSPCEVDDDEKNKATLQCK